MIRYTGFCCKNLNRSWRSCAPGVSPILNSIWNTNNSSKQSQCHQSFPTNTLKDTQNSRCFHTSTSTYSNQSETTETNVEKSPPKKTGRAGQLAKVFAEYGTTAVIFHTTISLTSLGICYTAVSSGIDVVGLLQKINLISEATAESKLASGAGTFVVAYACHKVFMPARIFLTVSCTPVIVKRLRKLGFLKTVKKTETKS